MAFIRYKGNIKMLNKKRYGVVLYDEPNIQSPAALALLVKRLTTEDTTVWNSTKWLKFRVEYLHNICKIFGHIDCHYCPKTHLKIETKDKNKLATIDHVIPLSKGGEMWNLDNLVPACYTCNMRKGDKILVGA